MSNTRSIRTKLLVSLLSLQLVFWITAFLGGIYLSAELTRRVYDDDLADAAHILGSRLVMRGHHLALGMSHEAVRVLLGNGSDAMTFQIRDPSGTIVAGNPLIPAFEDAGGTELKYRNARIKKERFRVLNYRFRSSVTHGVVTVAVAQSRSPRAAVLRKVANGLLPLLAALLVMAAVLISFVVNHEFKALRRIRNSILKRSPSDLTPVEVGNTPLEVEPLLRAINHLIRSVREEHEWQNRFLASTAHQLRTPLAGLQTQIDLLIGDSKALSDTTVASIQKSIRRLIRLVTQLLVLARAEQKPLAQKQFGPINLEKVAREVATELAPQALARGLEFQFRPSDAEATINGDVADLHELAANLIHNAILYTPRGGEVTVSVELTSELVRLSVEDTGPGIPASERERIFERFYRIPNTGAEGTGLGLAIVKEIATQHRATLHVDNGANDRGTRVSVEFARFAVAGTSISANNEEKPRQALVA